MQAHSTLPKIVLNTSGVKNNQFGSQLVFAMETITPMQTVTPSVNHAIGALLVPVTYMQMVIGALRRLKWLKNGKNVTKFQRPGTLPSPASTFMLVWNHAIVELELPVFSIISRVKSTSCDK